MQYIGHKKYFIGGCIDLLVFRHFVISEGKNKIPIESIAKSVKESLLWKVIRENF